MTIQNKLFLDIETLPPQGGGHLERILASIRPPGNIKKQESIDKWMAENAADAAAEKAASLGLDGLYGEVAVICFAVGDGQIVSRALNAFEFESDLIASAFDAMDFAAISEQSGTVIPQIAVGHNVADFDIRFLFQRAVRHGIKVPACLRGAFDPDKSRYNVIDTMKLWGGFKGYVKLKDLTRELCSDTAADIDGSEVATIWTTDPQKVIDHCIQDVERVRSLYKKLAITLGY